jgi:hypothetical protein
MFDLKRPKHQLAFSVIAILILLKFVIVPIFTWQNQQLSHLANLQKRASKSHSVITNQALIKASQQQVTAQLSSINELFITYQNEAEFKLTMQQKIEQKVEKYQLQITNSSWLPSIVVANELLIRHQLRLTIKGEMLNFISLVTLLESSTPKSELKSLNVNLKGQSRSNLGVIEGTLELAFYMKTQTNLAQEAG